MQVVQALVSSMPVKVSSLWWHLHCCIVPWECGFKDNALLCMRCQALHHMLDTVIFACIACVSPVVIDQLCVILLGFGCAHRLLFLLLVEMTTDTPAETYQA